MRGASRPRRPPTPPSPPPTWSPAGPRPPTRCAGRLGHHAGPGYYGGFCLLNNAAIAARSLASLGRVAVVDVDFHHGNGTQDVMFWEDPEVLYVSLHGDPAAHYPHFTGGADETGGGPGQGATRNLPLPDGTGDDAYLAALGQAMDQVAAFAGHPGRVGRLRHLRGRPDRRVQGDHRRLPAHRGLPWRAAGRPAVVVQEGGYAVEAPGANAVARWAGSATPAERSYLPTSFARYVLTSASRASRLPSYADASGCAKVGHVGGQPARQGFESPHPDLTPPGPDGRRAQSWSTWRSPGRRRSGAGGRSAARGR